MPADLRPPSPSLNEDVFDPTGYEDDPMVRAVRDALRKGRLGAEGARKVALALMANDMLTEPARHRETREKVHQRVKPAVEAIQRTLDRLHEEIGRLQTRLAGPPLPTSALEHLRVQEVRTALGSMSKSDRRKTVLAGLGDPTVAGAVLHGPTFLTSSSEEERADYRRRWRRDAHPAETARLEFLQQVSTHLERGGQLLVGYVARLYDHDLITKAEETEKRVREALQDEVQDDATVH